MKAISDVLKNSETIQTAVVDWHIARGGSMSDTVNQISFSESEAQIIAEWNKQVKEQTVYTKNEISKIDFDNIEL